MRTVVGAVLLLFAGIAGAQVIYKCRNATGGMVYSSDPCPSAAIQVGSKYFNTGPDDARAITQARNVQREMDQRNAAMHGGGGYVFQNPRPQSERDRQKEQCRLAREAEQRATRAGASDAYRSMLTRRTIDACFGL